MPGLTTSLVTAMHALMAQQGDLDSASNNIANANTPGYSRQVPVLVESEPTFEGSLVYGNGVQLQKFQSIRDQLLELRIQEETSQHSSADAQSSAAQQIQPLFAATGQDIGSQMSGFFESISQLSVDPANMSLRTGMITAGQNLAASFHSAVSGLVQIQGGLNGTVAEDVDSINQLTRQIAALNPKLLALQADGQDGGPVLDQQTELVRQLSQLTGVAITQTEGGITLTTGNGTPLVVGSQSFALQVATGNNGMREVMSQGQDVTAYLTSGSLGGVIESRDRVVPGILNQLDALASQFTTSFNTVHGQGTDLSGNAGGDFFTSLSSVSGAAAEFNVALTDPSAIALSSDGSAGSNGNAAQLVALQTAALPSGQNPTDSFSNLVYQVGEVAANAQAESDASSMSLAQLSDQRSSLSGVSVNEESVNLIRYQQAFQAAARIISIIDQLNAIVLNMGGAGAGY